MLCLTGPAHSRCAVCLSAAVIIAGAFAAPADASPPPQRRGCLNDRAFGHLVAESRWTQHGASVERRELPAAPSGYPLLVRVEEDGVDVEVEVLDRSGSVVARADSPVDRSAVQFAYLPAGSAGASLLVKAKEPKGLEGTVRVAFLAADAAAAPEGSMDCVIALPKWADGDMSYARGREVTFGRATAEAGTAHAAFEAAGRDYTLAREALQGPGHASERGLLELNLSALAYYGLKDWNGSASWAAKASATFAATHDTYQRARAQALQAAAWIELATQAATVEETARTPRPAHARFTEARALLATLARLHAARHESYDRALQVNNIGLTYTYESRFEAAIPYYLRAQRSFDDLGDTNHSALALQNIGYCEWGLGRLSAALLKLDRAVDLLASMERPSLYLIALNNDGLAHYEAGRLDEALRLETLALDLATRLQSDQARARSDFGIGVTYYAIGDRGLAAEFLRRGLDIATPGLDARLRVDTLRALAQIESETGRLQDAINHDSEALRLASASWSRAHILLHLAQQYAGRGDDAGSRRILDELISHPPNHDELVRAEARVQRARLYHADRSYRPAQTDLLGAIETFDRLDALAERFDARVELARVYADQGLSAPALTMLRQAFRYSREIRAQTANPEYRTSISQSLRPALSLELDLLRARFGTLTKQGHLEAAQALAQESLSAVDGERAAGFEAWRAEYLEQHSDKELAHLLSSSSTLYRDMAERRFELTVREDRSGTEDHRAQALRDDIARLRAQLGVITAEVARRSQRAGSSLSDGVELTGGAGRMFPSGRGLIEYWLGSPHAYAWVLKEGSVDWIELPASGDIERAARNLHAVMRAPATAAARREACTELYRLALAPLGSALVGVRELIIVPDGSLHYAPFSALRDPTRSDRPYLVQTVTVSEAPALRFLPSRAPTAAADKAAARMLLVADPIYAASDPRLGEANHGAALATSLKGDREVLRGTGGAQELVRLASSAREASEIRALLGAQNVDLLQGEDATREAVLSKDLTRYRFIHIASHGLIDAEIPELSALILGTHGRGGLVSDPYLRAADFLTKTFHAQAIVLSACDTALGKEYGSEGLVGLRYAALARGAHAVVASLWPVSDGTAATLMANMYRGLMAADGPGAAHPRTDGLQVARALSAAMREELERAPELDPALWAPFTVYLAGG